MISKKKLDKRIWTLECRNSENQSNLYAVKSLVDAILDYFGLRSEIVSAVDAHFKIVKKEKKHG